MRLNDFLFGSDIIPNISYKEETVGKRGSMVTMPRSEELEKMCALYRALENWGELWLFSFSGPCRVLSYGHRLCFSQPICVRIRIGNAIVGNEGDYFL